MNNLKLDGYEMISKRKGLDLDTAKIVFEQLADLHATTYHFLQTYPGGFAKFSEDFPLCLQKQWMTFDEKIFPARAVYHKVINRIVMILEQVIKSEESLRLARKMEKYLEQDVNDACTEYLKPKDDFNILTHGDCWSNNFLFKKSKEGKPTEVALVDFQLMRYGPPSVDLWYCLASSTSLRWRRDNLDTILTCYHQRLSKNLTTYGYDPLTVFPYRMFLEQFDACHGLGFVLGCFLAIVKFFAPKTLC